MPNKDPNFWRIRNNFQIRISGTAVVKFVINDSRKTSTRSFEMILLDDITFAAHHIIGF